MGKGNLILIICVGIFILIYPAVALSQDSEGEPNAVGLDSVRANKPVIYPGFGAALVRNELAPVFHINIGYNHKNRYEANFNTSSYFFFSKGSNSDFHVHRNTFLNAEFLLNFSPLSKSLKNWNGLGVGYLVEARGGMFTETTTVVYYKRRYRFLSVMPGLIFDDNFKDVWPVISVRL
jgi:hypothetical protein